MPLYEYECLDCGATFEKLAITTSHPSRIECPRCQSRNVENRVSTFASPVKSGSAGSSGSCAPGGG